MTFKTKTLFTLGLCALLSGGLSGCVSVSAHSYACQGQSETQTSMFFGRSIPNGGSVSNTQWDSFTRTIIAAHFPDGFTTLDAVGYWKDRTTKITGSEDSKVLLVFHENTPENHVKIKAIADAYIKRFKQQAVIASSQDNCLVFYEGQKP